MSSELTKFTLPIIKELEQVEKEILTELGSYNELLIQSTNHLLNAGGKRLRPILVLLISKATVPELNYNHILLASAVELLHTATLIHDDIIDNAVLRRGIPSVNYYWNEKISVIAGDFLLAKASYFISKIKNIHLNFLFSKTVMEMCNGEIKQLSDRYNTVVNWENYINKTQLKTAILLSAACQGSAIINSVSSNLEEVIREYGLNLGTAFQIIDDILDFSDNSSQIGKPICNDLKHGILTAPVLFALSDSPKKEELKELIKGKFKSQEELDQAVKIIKEGDSIEKSKKLADSYILKAYESLSNIPYSPVHENLIELTDFVLKRKI